jgi:CubicO group peptidase (beta-lactamase class C family)
MTNPLKSPSRSTALLLLLFAGLLEVPDAAAQNPGPAWERYLTPEQAGWSGDKLHRIFEGSGAAALMITYKGRVVGAFGATERRFPCASVRKSLLSALYGIHVELGDIDVDSTLQDLRIDDITPITEQEKEARVRDLLTARSGIYLPAGSESESMRRSRPERGSHEPGTFWYYNNWDFNVLGTIFEKQTRTTIFDDFYQRIALPLQMEQFRVMDGSHDYSERSVSIHPAYPFKMSARDMARIGQLYLRRGTWNGKQIIPRPWIAESTSAHSSFSDQGPGYGGYGYLWWINPDFGGSRTFFASGHGGHYIGVFPAEEVVIVFRPDWYSSGSISGRQELIEKIFEARVSNSVPDPDFVALPSAPHVETIELSREVRRKYAGAYSGQYVDLYGTEERGPGGASFFIVERDGGLVLEQFPYFYRFRLLPLSTTRFLVEDLELFLVFELDGSGAPVRPIFHASEETERLYNTFVHEGIAAAVKQHEGLDAPVGREFDLRYLAHNLQLAGKTDATVEVLKLRMVENPQAERTHHDFIKEYLKHGDIGGLSNEYARALLRFESGSADPGLLRWFAEWVQARAYPAPLSEEVQRRYVGRYGPRHIVAREGALYYYRDDRPTITEYRLLKASEDLFVLDHIDYFRIRFVMGDDEKATALVGTYVDGRRDESPRSR